MYSPKDTYAFYRKKRENGLYGMIDGKGNWLIQPRFSQLTEKNSDKAHIKNENILNKDRRRAYEMSEL
jgi:hypothetical protein